MKSRLSFVIFSVSVAFWGFSTETRAKSPPTPPSKSAQPLPSSSDQKKPKIKTHPSVKSLAEGLDLLNPTQKKKPKPERQAVTRQEAFSQLSPRSLFVLAGAYEQKGDYENQVLTLRKLVQKNKKNPLYLLELAKGLRNLYFKTGLFKQREEAIKVINQVYALKNKKYQERAHLEMLELLKFTEDLEETKYDILKLLQTLIREFGIKKNYVRDLCKYLYLNKFYGQSQASCSKAMKYYPKEPKNYIYYGLSLEDSAEKEKHLKQTARRFPHSPFVQLKMGQFFIQQKDWAEALPHFKKVAKLQPDSAPAQLGLAQALFHTGKEKESYKVFLRACMLDKAKMLWAFKQAKSILNQKGRFALASSFDNGITQCFIRAQPPSKKN